MEIQKVSTEPSFKIIYRTPTGVTVCANVWWFEYMFMFQGYDNSTEDVAGRMETKYYTIYGDAIFTGLLQYFTL